MPDGSRRAIAEVKVGDRVLATDPVTGRSGARAVTATFANVDDDLVDATVRDANSQDGVVKTTAHHKFWSATAHGWVQAGDLHGGDRLLQADAATASVVTLTHRPGCQTMLDLTVETDHTFYVNHDTETAAVLVHNCGRASASEFSRTEALSGRSDSRAVKQIAESMKSRGYVGDPVEEYELNGTKYIVNGHHRVAAARIAGIEIEYRRISLQELLSYGYRSEDDLLRSAFSVGPDEFARRGARQQ